MGCAPTALPFLFSQELKSGKQNAWLVTLFLIGRLLGYIAIGFLLALIGSYTLKYVDPALERRIMAVASIAMGAILLLAGLWMNFPTLKICSWFGKVYKPEWSSFALGLFTGLSICPPFFAAATRVFESGDVFYGIGYFFLFFLGTSVFILPLFGIFFIKKYMDKIRMVARLTMLLMGVYFVVFLGLFKL